MSPMKNNIPYAVGSYEDEVDGIEAPDATLKVVNDAEDDEADALDIEDEEAITVKKELLKALKPDDDDTEEEIDEDLLDAVASTNVNLLEQDIRVVSALMKIQKKRLAKAEMHPKRKMMLEKTLEKAKVNNTLISSVINRATDKIPETVLPISTLTGVENAKFNNFNKHYDNHTREYDIVQTALHLSKADVPLFVENIKVTPSSKEEIETIHELVEMSFKDEDGNSHTAKVKIPKAYRGKLLVNNTRYTIDNQETPLVVTRDRDAVVITANYNKMYIENLYGKYISPKMSRLVKLVKAIDGKPGVSVILTDCSSDNKGVSICSDLVEVSREIKKSLTSSNVALAM